MWFTSKHTRRSPSVRSRIRRISALRFPRQVRGRSSRARARPRCEAGAHSSLRLRTHWAGVAARFVDDGLAATVQDHLPRSKLDSSIQRLNDRCTEARRTHSSGSEMSVAPNGRVTTRDGHATIYSGTLHRGDMLRSVWLRASSSQKYAMGVMVVPCSAWMPSISESGPRRARNSDVLTPVDA